MLLNFVAATGHQFRDGGHEVFDRPGKIATAGVQGLFSMLPLIVQHLLENGAALLVLLAQVADGPEHEEGLERFPEKHRVTPACGKVSRGSVEERIGGDPLVYGIDVT